MGMESLKDVQLKLMKGLLDLIVLQLLSASPMHGYQIISKIRRNFGIYFGPSTIYPLLNSLEKSGYVKSEWDMSHDRPRKVYTLTDEGKNLLRCAEESLNLICKKIGMMGIPKAPMVEETSSVLVMSGPLLKRMKKSPADLAGHGVLSIF
ncbi:MAG: PadR family transcriptional regulator [Candidatus Bathyarchaeota archaeon]|nr:PadR family transcriptional regulator [Candidatus Bathyarchaeota archaeon]